MSSALAWLSSCTRLTFVTMAIFNYLPLDLAIILWLILVIWQVGHRLRVRSGKGFSITPDGVCQIKWSSWPAMLKTLSTTKQWHWLWESNTSSSFNALPDKGILWRLVDSQCYGMMLWFLINIHLRIWISFLIPSPLLQPRLPINWLLWPRELLMMLVPLAIILNFVKFKLVTTM